MGSLEYKIEAECPLITSLPYVWLALLKNVMPNHALQDRLQPQQFYRFSQYFVSDVPSADPEDFWLQLLFPYYKILGVIFSFLVLQSYFDVRPTASCCDMIHRFLYLTLMNSNRVIQ